jgi:2-hydroxychromene-2-carboxylate isomerase
MSTQTANVPPGELDIWFEFGSTYSYLSVMRIDDLAARHGVFVRWRPFMLGPIFKELGWQGSPFLEQKEKLAYMWKDMAQQSRKYELPWRQPSVFPRAAVLPLRVALVAADEAWVSEFCRAMMLKNFADDEDIASTDVVRGVLLALGLQADAIIENAQAEPNKLALRHQTERARALGIFGGPTFFAGDEMFWGNDRLEDAMQAARRSAR